MESFDKMSPKMRETLKDEDGNGIPDYMEGKSDILKSPKLIIMDGKIYHGIDEMSDAEKEVLKSKVNTLKSIRTDQLSQQSSRSRKNFWILTLGIVLLGTICGFLIFTFKT